MSVIVELIFEIILEFVFEGSLELGMNRKVSKPVRILAIALFILGTGGLIAFMIWLSVVSMQEVAVALGVMLIVLTIIILFGLVWKFIKEYKIYKEKIRK